MRQNCLYKENKCLLDDYIDKKEGRKEFAKKVGGTPYGGVCFALADGRYASGSEYFKTLLKRGDRSAAKKLIEQFKLTSVVDSSWRVVDNEEEDVV